MIRKLTFTKGYRTSLAEGVLVPDSPFHMVTEHFFHAYQGEKISLNALDYVYAVATYSLQREEKYLYSYDYKVDETWTTYQKDLTVDSYNQEPYVFLQECFFRICVKKVDGKIVTDEDVDNISDNLCFWGQMEYFSPKPCFKEEIEKKATEVLEKRDLLKMCLLTDSHYTVNGTWEDTTDNIEKVLKKAPVDAIVHMGDFTDGMTSEKVTSDYVEKMMQDLLRNQIPVFVTPGNHDSNYFKNNPEPLSKEKQMKLFHLQSPDYFVDYHDYKIRCLFLWSYDYQSPIPYGFDEEQINWVQTALDSTPKNYKVLIFSHEAPLARLDYWSDIIRNGEKLVTVLEEYNKREECQILAYIHGHSHAEQVYRGSGFPIISIGCNKCEYFTDKKPDESNTYERRPDTCTQDLWDILIADPKEEKLEFIRFGAGENRIVDCRKTKSIWRQEELLKKQKRKTKIWAHRGASGRAPENTLPAFLIAKELHIDGIELDVQMTKDGELVITHDETIDRVSNGQGYVKDYTFAELRTFNFAKNFPKFGFVTIPTLKEVYELFQDSDYIINVELKTGIFRYEGTGQGDSIEEKVHALTVEMGMEDKVIYSSFNHESVMQIKKLATKEQTAFLYSDGYLNMPEYAQKHGVDALHPAEYLCTDVRFIEECHNKGIKVNVWTVNSEAELLKLCCVSVDAVITNYPDLLKKSKLNE